MISGRNSINSITQEGKRQGRRRGEGGGGGGGGGGRGSGRMELQTPLNSQGKKTENTASSMCPTVFSTRIDEVETAQIPMEAGWRVRQSDRQ